MKFLLIAFFLFPALSKGEEQKSNFVKAKLPLGISVEVPGNWWVLSKELNQTLAAVAEAGIELADVDVPYINETVILRASSRPKETYANITITATKAEMTKEDFQTISDEELADITPELKGVYAAILKPGGFKLITFEPIKKVQIGEYIGMTISYVRSGPKGDVRVEINRLVVHDKEVTFQFSYRITEKVLWVPVITKMRRSIAIQ